VVVACRVWFGWGLPLSELSDDVGSFLLRTSDNVQEQPQIQHLAPRVVVSRRSLIHSPRVARLQSAVQRLSYLRPQPTRSRDVVRTIARQTQGLSESKRCLEIACPVTRSVGLKMGRRRTAERLGGKQARAESNHGRRANDAKLLSRRSRILRGIVETAVPRHGNGASWGLRIVY
jgi:hypothetical protein